MSAISQVLPKLVCSNLARRTYGALLQIPGVGETLQKLVHACMPEGTRLWVRIPQGLGEGLWMNADPRVELGYAKGTHEPWLQDLLKVHLKKGDCCYDLGAHTGFFALIAARRVGPSGMVLAVEADGASAAITHANAARNELNQIIVLNSAVWSSCGSVNFERASASTQGHVSTRTQTSARSVSAITLDDLVYRESRPVPAFIKMDVEGAEWDVLQGSRRLLAEAKPKLLCEIHDPEQSEQIRDLLAGYGYQSEEWKPFDPNYPDYQQHYIWAVK